jgi:hypothetical protein
VWQCMQLHKIFFSSPSVHLLSSNQHRWWYLPLCIKYKKRIIPAMEQESGYIFGLWQPIIIPPVCVDLRILVYSWGYYVYLLGDCYKYRSIKTVSGIIHNYHKDKLVTARGNNHLITYLGQGILFSSHSVEVWEYWCNLEYSVVL